jgi:hypothetical protein
MIIIIIIIIIIESSIRWGYQLIYDVVNWSI